ncbi:putative mitochondrial protein AtMg00820 [Primulina tabacum]|uniref:putative mitochondrial protein AtMg00820 n=1 Tax=Primulina tabacum TaxID=48773 RepID=UPI003F596400
MIFIGYSDESKGYRLWNPIKNLLVVSRDVVFDEMAAWQWNEYVCQSPPIHDFVEPPFFHNCESHPSTSQQSPKPTTVESDSEISDPDSPIRKVRSLHEIYDSCILALFSNEPQFYDEAKNNDVLIQAMKEEIAVIEKNRTWDLVDLPKGKDVIGLKWIYKTKYGEDGSIRKHKACLVAKGYAQQPGVDFNETFAPMVRMETIISALAIAAQLQLNVFQLDVKSAL